MSLGSNTFTVSGYVNVFGNLVGSSSLTGGTVLGPGTLAFGAKATSSLSGLTLSGATLSNAGAMTLSGALTLGGCFGHDRYVHQREGRHADLG